MVWEGRSREAPPYPDHWHKTDLRECPVQCPLTGAMRKSHSGAGKTAFDPNVWSGRALQVVSPSLAVSGLASMYSAFDWSICSGPSWISARMRSHYRTGLDWTIWVTSVRMRREDRSSISSHPLADLGWKLLLGLRHRLLPISLSSVVRAKGRCEHAKKTKSVRYARQRRRRSIC